MKSKIEVPNERLNALKRMISVSTPNLQNLSFFPEKVKFNKKEKELLKNISSNGLCSFETNGTIPQHLRENIVEDGSLKPHLIIKVLAKSIEQIVGIEFLGQQLNSSQKSLQLDTIETILEILGIIWLSKSITLEKKTLNSCITIFLSILKYIGCIDSRCSWKNSLIDSTPENLKLYQNIKSKIFQLLQDKTYKSSVQNFLTDYLRSSNYIEIIEVLHVSIGFCKVNYASRDGSLFGTTINVGIGSNLAENGLRQILAKCNKDSKHFSGETMEKLYTFMQFVINSKNKFVNIILCGILRPSVIENSVELENNAQMGCLEVMDSFLENSTSIDVDHDNTINGHHFHQSFDQNPPPSPSIDIFETTNKSPISRMVTLPNDTKFSENNSSSNFKNKWGSRMSTKPMKRLVQPLMSLKKQKMSLKRQAGIDNSKESNNNPKEIHSGNALGICFENQDNSCSHENVVNTPIKLLSDCEKNSLRSAMLQSFEDLVDHNSLPHPQNTCVNNKPFINRYQLKTNLEQKQIEIANQERLFRLKNLSFLLKFSPIGSIPDMRIMYGLFDFENVSEWLRCAFFLQIINAVSEFRKDVRSLIFMLNKKAKHAKEQTNKMHLSVNMSYYGKSEKMDSNEKSSSSIGAHNFKGADYHNFLHLTDSVFRKSTKRMASNSLKKSEKEQKENLENEHENLHLPIFKNININTVELSQTSARLQEWQNAISIKIQHSRSNSDIINNFALIFIQQLSQTIDSLSVLGNLVMSMKNIATTSNSDTVNTTLPTTPLTTNPFLSGTISTLTGQKSRLSIISNKNSDQTGLNFDKQKNVSDMNFSSNASQMSWFYGLLDHLETSETITRKHWFLSYEVLAKIKMNTLVSQTQDSDFRKRINYVEKNIHSAPIRDLMTNFPDIISSDNMRTEHQMDLKILFKLAWNGINTKNYPVSDVCSSLAILIMTIHPDIVNSSINDDFGNSKKLNDLITKLNHIWNSRYSFWNYINPDYYHKDLRFSTGVNVATPTTWIGLSDLQIFNATWRPYSLDRAINNMENTSEDSNENDKNNSDNQNSRLTSSGSLKSLKNGKIEEKVALIQQHISQGVEQTIINDLFSLDFIRKEHQKVSILNETCKQELKNSKQNASESFPMKRISVHNFHHHNSFHGNTGGNKEHNNNLSSAAHPNLLYGLPSIPRKSWMGSQDISSGMAGLQTSTKNFQKMTTDTTSTNNIHKMHNIPAVPQTLYNSIILILESSKFSSILDNDGYSLASNVRQTVWQWLCDDSIILLRQCLEDLQDNSPDLQNEAYRILSQILHLNRCFPTRAASTLLNYTLGIIGHHKRKIGYEEMHSTILQTSTYKCISVLNNIIPYNIDISWKQIKQSLRKEGIDIFWDCYWGSTVCKKMIIFGPAEHMLPTQMEDPNDTSTFGEVWFQAISFYRIPEGDRNCHFLEDVQTGYIHDFTSMIKYHYPFDKKRSTIVPCVKLVKLEQEQAYKKVQNQFNQQMMSDLIKIQLCTTLIQSQELENRVKDVVNQMEELSRLPNFPRKIIDYNPFVNLFPGKSVPKTDLETNLLFRHSWNKYLYVIFSTVALSKSEILWKYDLNPLHTILASSLMKFPKSLIISRYYGSCLLTTSYMFTDSFKKAVNSIVKIHLVAIFKVYCSGKSNKKVMECLEFLIEKLHQQHRQVFLVNMICTASNLLQKNSISKKLTFQLFHSLSKESKDVANILELTPVQIEKPVDQLYNNELRLSTFDKILATAGLIVIEDPLSSSCYDVLYFMKSMLPFFMEKQGKRLQEGKFLGPNLRSKISYNQKLSNIDLNETGAIGSLTRMAVHQASTVSESTVGSIQGVSQIQISSCVSWAKELSSLINNLLEVTQISFLNKLKRMMDEASKDNMRGAERSIQLTSIKNFLQVIDSLVYIQISWSQFCANASNDSLPEMILYSGRNNINTIVNIVTHILKTISEENVNVLVELPGLEYFFKFWCTDLMWIRLKNNGNLQMILKKMLALVAKCTTLKLQQNSVPTYLIEFWRSLKRLVIFDTNYRILREQSGTNTCSDELFLGDVKSPGQHQKRFRRWFKYADSFHSDASGNNVQFLNCIDDSDREQLLQVLFPCIDHQSNKKGNPFSKDCEFQNHFNWSIEITTISVQIVTNCLLTFVKNGKIRESLDELTKKHNSSFSTKCQISNCDIKFQLPGEDVHKELVNWLHANNLLVLVILDWSKNWPEFTKKWIFSLTKDILLCLNQCDVHSFKEEGGAGGDQEMNKKSSETGFDGFLDFGNKFYNIQQSIMFKFLIVFFQLIITAYESYFDDEEWSELGDILEDLLVKLSQKMDNVTLQFIEFCSLAKFPFCKKILPKMYRLLDGTYFSFSDKGNSELNHCDSLRVQKLKIVLEQGFSVKLWNYQSIYSDYLSVYKGSLDKILHWNLDTSEKAAGNEPMTNKLLKLLGSKGTGCKNKTANLSGNKTFLGKNINNLGVTSDLSHTSSDVSSSGNNRAKIIRLPKVVRKNIENIKASGSSNSPKSGGSPKTSSSPRTKTKNSSNANSESPAGIQRMDSSTSQTVGGLSLAASPTLELSRTSSVTTVREDNLSSSQSTIRNGSTRKISWSRKL